MAEIIAWEHLASVSKDRGEYFPDLNAKVGEWNKKEELFIRRNLKDKTKTILDLGCGDGRALAWLKEVGFESLYGLDVSKTAIARAKERLGTSANLMLWNYINGLPPYKIKFDIVLLMGNTVIAGLEEPVNLLKEIKNILKEDGLLFITCWNGEFLTKEIIDSYYGKIGAVKVSKVDLANRVFNLDDLVNKWLLESELRDIISKAGLKVRVLKKAGMGFLCTVSK